jgi:hypothetical protein
LRICDRLWYLKLIFPWEIKAYTMAKYFISLALSWDNGTINVCHPCLLLRAGIGSFLASEQGSESFRALHTTGNGQPRQVPFVLCFLAYNHAEWAPLLFYHHWYWIWLPIMLHWMGMLCILIWLCWARDAVSRDGSSAVSFHCGRTRKE